ncbi:MAG: nucleotidyltransferase family protein [Alphaproteobacteria bacterium]|jgi:MurNAc alpha-1-phosphate uridylyltransferase|nr:nucleotidyltransferase family protein [Alphaproteobacteria bacterium]
MTKIDTAMVLAAGLGLRLRPLTERTPKPLIPVAGKPLIDYVLDRLAGVGVEKAVVNVHWQADKLRAYLSGRTKPRIEFSDETAELLETGGGVAKALPQLGPGPFFVLNSDMIWRDAYEDSLKRLAAAWDGERMDALLLVVQTINAIGYDGLGDFTMDPDGRLTRRDERFVAPYLYAGVQILHPRLFEGAPAGRFSLNRLYDKAAENGRLYAILHEGDWMDVGHPEGLAAAERALGPG